MSHKKEMIAALIKICLWRYLDDNIFKSNEKFEEYINKSADKPDQYTKQEAVAVIKHFRKEIFPLDRKTILWMYKNLKNDEINYCTKFKEIKKLK